MKNTTTNNQRRETLIKIAQLEHEQRKISCDLRSLKMQIFEEDNREIFEDVRRVLERANIKRADFQKFFKLLQMNVCSQLFTNVDRRAKDSPQYQKYLRDFHAYQDALDTLRNAPSNYDEVAPETYDEEQALEAKIWKIEREMRRIEKTI